MSLVPRAALFSAGMFIVIPFTAVAHDAPKSAELPAVTVTTPSKTHQAASKSQKSKSQVNESKTPAPPSQPAGPAAADASAESVSANPGIQISPGMRSGSLTAPTAAEAKADIETTPGGVDLVPSEEFAKTTPSVTLKDALDYVPGVFVQPKWGEDSRLSIRGSGLSRNFHGRGVFLLMDGVIPVTTADGGSFFLEIDPTSYRYIEVYKGSNALRYGANSLGGAINFVMPTGYDSAGESARVDVGSFGFRKLAASSGGVAGPADYFVSGTIQEQDGFRDHSSGESQRGSVNVGYRLSEDAETRFYVNANRIRQDIPGSVRRSVALSSPRTARASNVINDNELNFDSLRVANKTAIRVAPGSLVEFGGYYFYREMDHPIFRVFDNEFEDYGGFARASGEGNIAGFRNRLTAGVNIQAGVLNSLQYANVAGQRGALISDTDQTSRITTLYAENSFYALPNFALVAGAQFSDVARNYEVNFSTVPDGDRSPDFDFWNPKAGFVWEVTPSSQIFGNISKSSEAPTFSETRFVGAALPTLKPQEATTFEVGTRGQTPGFSWDVALYRANLRNEFQCLDSGVGGSCDQINLAATIHQGIEAGASARVFSGLFELGPNADEVWVNAAYTFSDFRFDGDKDYGDNELPGAPRHFLRAELLYKHSSGLYAGPNVEWVPESFFVDSANTLTTKAYALLGAKLGFDDGGPWTAYIEARNLADKAYIASASVATIATANSELFEPGNGRAVYGGVQIKW